MLKKLKQYRTLLVRILVISALIIGVYLLYQLYKSFTGESEYAIDETPLKVEQIKSIAEINTLKFQDEVVVDSLEMYKSVSETVSGSLGKLLSYNDFMDGITPSAIKRRLTLIIKGELLFGVDLKEEIKTNETKDTLYFSLPSPKILSLSINPKGIEIFAENGTWNDIEHKQLLEKAKRKMEITAEELHLKEKAKVPLIKLIRQLVPSKKPIKITFRS